MANLNSKSYRGPGTGGKGGGKLTSATGNNKKGYHGPGTGGKGGGSIKSGTGGVSNKKTYKGSPGTSGYNNYGKGAPKTGPKGDKK